MSKIGNGSILNKSKVSHRQIPHSRIDDEEIIFKKYELGRKLGQVNWEFSTVLFWLIYLFNFIFIREALVLFMN